MTKSMNILLVSGNKALMPVVIMTSRTPAAPIFQTGLTNRKKKARSRSLKSALGELDRSILDPGGRPRIPPKPLKFGGIFHTSHMINDNYRKF
jgi:hypothetical protein